MYNVQCGIMLQTSLEWCFVIYYYIQFLLAKHAAVEILNNTMPSVGQ